LLLAAAFSPVLIDLLEHVAQHPWAGYCLVFLPLFSLELHRGPRGTTRSGLGSTLLGLALAAELLLVGGGLTRAARFALALGALGLAWIEGRPTPRRAALLLWLVPVPSALVSWGSPGPVAVWAHAAVALLQRVGRSAVVELDRGGVVVEIAGARLPLLDADGGLPVLALLTGLVWYGGLRRGWSLPGTALRFVPCILLAGSVQTLAIALAALAVGAGASVRPALDVAPWASVALMGLLGLRGEGRRTPPGADSASGASHEPLSSRTP